MNLLKVKPLSTFLENLRELCKNRRKVIPFCAVAAKNERFCYELFALTYIWWKVPSKAVAYFKGLLLVQESQVVDLSGPSGVVLIYCKALQKLNQRTFHSCFLFGFFSP